MPQICRLALDHKTVSLGRFSAGARQPRSFCSTNRSLSDKLLKTAPDFLMLDQNERCLRAAPITELIRFDLASMSNGGDRFLLARCALRVYAEAGSTGRPQIRLQGGEHEHRHNI